MNEQYNVVGIIIGIAMAIAFLTSLVSLSYLRTLFMTDNKITNSTKIIYAIFRAESLYIEDLPENRKARYLKSLKIVKYSMLAFAIGFLLQIIESIVSAF